MMNNKNILVLLVIILVASNASAVKKKVGVFVRGEVHKDVESDGGDYSAGDIVVVNDTAEKEVRTVIRSIGGSSSTSSSKSTSMSSVQEAILYSKAEIEDCDFVCGIINFFNGLF